MLDIKRMLDPKGILNPGKIFDAAPVSDTSLGEPNMPAWHEGPFNGAAGPDGGEHNVLSLTELGEGVSRMTEGMQRAEEHTSELQSLMRISYAVFCLKKKKRQKQKQRKTARYQ